MLFVGVAYIHYTNQVTILPYKKLEYMIMMFSRNCGRGWLPFYK